MQHVYLYPAECVLVSQDVSEETFPSWQDKKITGITENLQVSTHEKESVHQSEISAVWQE